MEQEVWQEPDLPQRLELFAKSNNDALGATDVCESICVFVLYDFADQFGAVGEQTRDKAVNLFDGEHNAADAKCLLGASAPVMIGSGVWNLSSSIRP